MWVGVLRLYIHEGSCLYMRVGYLCITILYRYNTNRIHTRVSIFALVYISLQSTSYSARLGSMNERYVRHSRSNST